jgi:hypothetical protein
MANTIYSTNGDNFKVKHLDRSYGGKETTVLSVDGTDGTVKVGATQTTIFTGSLLSAVAVGADNTSSKGYATVAATKIGDKLIAAANITDSSDVQTKFEATITVAGQIQQSSGTDNLSAKTILFLLQRP